ncbi:hypothetical protein REPUB_Repub04eG0059700 [Reevesia pubescens]
MGTNTSVSLILLLLAAEGISLAMFPLSAKADDHQLRETKMTMYFQDNSSGPNSTVRQVTGLAGKLWSLTQFGTLYVIDDPITEGPNPTSAIVGRGQGMFITTSLNGLNVHVSFSIVFTNKAYNGSTILIEGNSKQFEAVRELAVVSGTGKFRYARGYATFENYSLDRSISYAVICCNVTVRHY